MKKIVTVIGARPQFIKASVVSKALNSAGIPEIIIHTGQHYDEKMSAVFWHELDLTPPEMNLKTGSNTHGKQTAECLTKLEHYLIANKNAIAALLVYGDTNSTLAGALAAAKLHIPVIHVEAGLRSFNRQMPEEINRIVTDHISDLLFCSSENGVKQLAGEGITRNVYNTGDVMHDALLIFSEIAGQKKQLSDIIPFSTHSYNLATIHRPSNTDDLNRLQQIVCTLDKLDRPVVWPVHPRNRDKITKLDIPASLHIMPPATYFEMVLLLKHTYKVLTDSGGLQKEAYWFKKPCITLRTETEWTETTQGGWNTITGADAKTILEAYYSEPQTPWKPLYGDGTASQQIAEKIKSRYYPDTP